MSKKSRKRNRRLLKAAALIGGLAMMGRRKGTAAADVDSGRGGDSSSAAARVAANAVTGTTYPGANKVVAAPIKKPVDTSSNFQTRFKAKGDDGVWRGPGQILAERRLTAGNQIPPSMRGGAETAQGFVRKVPVGHRTRGRSGVKYGWSTTPYKKGGRVKLAKRGLGRAFTKAKK